MGSSSWIPADFHWGDRCAACSLPAGRPQMSPENPVFFCAMSSPHSIASPTVGSGLECSEHNGHRTHDFPAGGKTRRLPSDSIAGSVKLGGRRKDPRKYRRMSPKWSLALQRTNVLVAENNSTRGRERHEKLSRRHSLGTAPFGVRSERFGMVSRFSRQTGRAAERPCLPGWSFLVRRQRNPSPSLAKLPTSPRMNLSRARRRSLKLCKTV